MNFFGHATIACDSLALPTGVLGAMLPDFTSMVRTRLPHTDDPDLAAGIALHHATDAVFHRAPSFIALCRRSMDMLCEEGLTRGSARAVAHVGTELLLDGCLSHDVVILERYQAALAWGASDSGLRSLHWQDADGATRWREGIERIAQAQLPVRYRDAEFVADRMQWILAARPRLALGVTDLPAVNRWAHDHLPHVATLFPSLLTEVRVGLEATE